MRDFKWCSVVLIGLIINFSCGKALPPLNDIEVETWQADKNGCAGKREPSIEHIKEQRRNFLGLSEMEIVKVFGMPDRNELYKRNQKFYYYYLQASPDCPTHLDAPLKLAIRFNAMGLAKEISVE